MVKNINRQRGMGMLGILFVLMVIGFVTTVGIKVAPLYLDNVTIAGVMKDIAADKMNSEATLRQLQDSMQRRLQVNQLDDWVKQAKFIKEDGKRVIELNYERRVNFWGNLDIVVVFENRAEL